MAITFISRFRVKPGRADELRAMAEMVAAQIATTKPGTSVFLPYLDETGSNFTIVHVFRDADAMADHFGGADKRSAAAYVLMEPAGWEIYGQPHEPQLAALRAEADAARIEVVVHLEELSGFLRPAGG